MTSLHPFRPHAFSVHSHIHRRTQGNKCKTAYYEFAGFRSTPGHTKLNVTPSQAHLNCEEREISFLRVQRFLPEAFQGSSQTFNVLIWQRFKLQKNSEKAFQPKTFQTFPGPQRQFNSSTPSGKSHNPDARQTIPEAPRCSSCVPARGVQWHASTNFAVIILHTKLHVIFGHWENRSAQQHHHGKPLA